MAYLVPLQAATNLRDNHDMNHRHLTKGNATGWYSLLLCVLLLLACDHDLPEEISAAMATLPAEIDYNQHIKPILSDRCFACHGPDEAKREAGLRLDLPEAAKAPLPDHPRDRAIVSRRPAKSKLVHKILSADPEVMMPPPDSYLSLSAKEKALLHRWIEEGGAYQDHWAFSKPQSREVPAVEQTAWPINPIDHFVLKQIEERGWLPAAQADKETLLRRVSFDLTGLPPSLAAIDDFLSDSTAGAYERVVDELLASPHYGEHLAVDWLDLARFADTHGYTVDRYRDMSPYRDWVIDAFNRNMAYDTFVTWQLAGDLLPQATREQIIASAFNRNHAQNMEGGIVPEEFRVEYVADRTNTLGTAFMGLTLGCARCHDHKYDPVSQRDYYELFSFFNNVREAGQISFDNATPVPTLLLTTPRVDSIRHFLRQEIDGLRRLIQSDEDRAEAEAWLTGQGYRDIPHEPSGAVAHFRLDKAPVLNLHDRSQSGVMRQQHVAEEIPFVFGEKDGRAGMLFNGDAWLDLTPVGVFHRASSFTLGLWVHLPSDIEDGVIIHKGVGAALYNFRGFHLALKDNRLELLMARSTPNNAIVEYGSDLPRDRWVHLTMTYDGSSTAQGLRVFVDGKELSTTVDVDNLYKDVLLHQDKQPGLQIGARWRGKGIGGALVSDLKVYERVLSSLEIRQLAGMEPQEEYADKDVSQLNPRDREILTEYYQRHHSKRFAARQADLAVWQDRLRTLMDTVPELMVMEEMTARRPAYVLERGQYDSYGEEVSPNTPSSILPWREDLPKNRLGLAQWLLDPDHPLTARVTVNRYWQMIFGAGLVQTTEDFGNQGSLPTHPALLDWLSQHFIDSGWDVKALLKLMVMSRTYLQSSKATDAIVAADPANALLARGPARRLSAEMLRDNILAASGLLVDRIGGPSVRPYQPEGLWRVNGARYRQDEGDKLYRRSLYTIWKRSVPHPTQGTFDAPTRSECTVRRQRTSTPLQALVMMNDPLFTEAAKKLGEAMTTGMTITQVFRILTGRHPHPKELRMLEDLQRQEQQRFAAAPEKQKGWLSAGESPISTKGDRALLAANAVVASTIINTDACIIKR